MRPYLYNGGDGKWIHCVHLALLRCSFFIINIRIVCTMYKQGHVFTVVIHIIIRNRHGTLRELVAFSFDTVILCLSKKKQNFGAAAVGQYYLK